MSRAARAAALAVPIAALAVLALAAASPAPVGAQQRRVVVVGDSVILGAQSTMVPAFAGRGWQVTFDAAVNRSSAAALGAVEAHRGELTDSLVLSVGANDAANTGAFAQRVAAILDATATVPHVYVLTIREVRDYYGPANQAIRDVAAGRPNVTVLDWHAATVGDASLTAADGLHLNGAGATRMTQLVTDAVVAGAVPGAAVPPAPTAAPTTPAPTAAPPTTPAPTTAAPTTTAPTTTAPTTTAPTTGRAPSTERVAEDALVDVGALWTVGGGVALVVAVLALAGVVLAGWSLATAGRPPTSGVPSAAHPAVRARQRAERIAAAADAADGAGITQQS